MQDRRAPRSPGVNVSSTGSSRCSPGSTTTAPARSSSPARRASARPASSTSCANGRAPAARSSAWASALPPRAAACPTGRSSVSCATSRAGSTSGRRIESSGASAGPWASTRPAAEGRVTRAAHRAREDALVRGAPRHLYPSRRAGAGGARARGSPVGRHRQRRGARVPDPQPGRAAGPADRDVPRRRARTHARTRSHHRRAGPAPTRDSGRARRTRPGRDRRRDGGHHRPAAGLDRARRRADPERWEPVLRRGADGGAVHALTAEHAAQRRDAPDRRTVRRGPSARRRDRDRGRFRRPPPPVRRGRARRGGLRPRPRRGRRPRRADHHRRRSVPVPARSAARSRRRRDHARADGRACTGASRPSSPRTRSWAPTGRATRSWSWPGTGGAPGPGPRRCRPRSRRATPWRDCSRCRPRTRSTSTRSRHGTGSTRRPPAPWSTTWTSCSVPPTRRTWPRASSTASVELAARALEELDPEQDPRRAAAALKILGRNAWAVGRAEDAFEAFRRAIELLSSGPPTAELAGAVAEEARCLMLAAKESEGAGRARDAIAIARVADAPLEEAHARCTLGTCLTTQGGVRRGLRGAPRSPRGGPGPR